MVPGGGSRDRFHPGLVILALALPVLAVYWQTGRHEFLPLDDDLYVTNNPNVWAGLSWKGAVWAFTSFEANNWHPLTWLSHMADVSLFGMNAGAHHLVNVFFHLINTALLFFLLRRITGAAGKSALVGFLFGIHPLHVESVAWVAERKDLLSTLFLLWTLLAYVRYAERPSLRRYLPVFLLMAAGLLSKPMLVTLPFVLLLLDYWPLGRTPGGRLRMEGSPRAPERSSWRGLIAEKAPLLVLSLASCAVTFLAQRAGGSVAGADFYPLYARSANALVSYAVYLGKTVWPASLGVYYPHPGMFVRWEATAAAGLLIMAVTIWTGAGRARHPYLLVGWLWYLGTLVPGIGRVQVGEQARADRYTYIPLTGIFLAAVWGAADVARSRRLPGHVLAAAAAVLVLAYSAASWRQVRHWRFGESLFRHTLEVTTDNWFITNNLGYVLDRQGKTDEALEYYRKSIRINPDYHLAHNNLGTVLFRQGRIGEARFHFLKALEGKPSDLLARRNLASLLVKTGEYEDAAFHLREILRRRPEDRDARTNLGVVLWLAERRRGLPHAK
jgi:tetratricopeptide (TPR) repeat protein